MSATDEIAKQVSSAILPPAHGAGMGGMFSAIDIDPDFAVVSEVKQLDASTRFFEGIKVPVGLAAFGVGFGVAWRFFLG